MRPDLAPAHSVRLTNRLPSRQVGWVSAAGAAVVLTLVALGLATTEVAPRAQWFAVALVVALLLGVLLVLNATRPVNLWDTATRTIVSNGRAVPFENVARVVVCTGAKGWYGLVFLSEDKHLARLTIPLVQRADPRVHRDVWFAVRALLASPHAPSLEGFGTPKVGAREFVRRAPRTATRGAGALAVIDAQVRWIDAGGSPRASDAPLERFRRGRRGRP